MPEPSTETAELSPALKLTMLQRMQLTLAAWIVPPLLWLIGSTLRITITYEEGSIRGLDDIKPGIFPFWHRCVLTAAYLFRNRGIGVLTSLSLDGEYIARVIHRLGFVPVRGSSSRGGWRGLLEMQNMVDSGETVAFTIDGPRGPRYVAKKGPILLARMTGVPVTPFYVAVEKGWVLKTWDATTIPKPFSRVYVRVSKHIFVPQDAGDAALERYHAEMQASLERITEFAESQFASRD